MTANAYRTAFVVCLGCTAAWLAACEDDATTETPPGAGGAGSTVVSATISTGVSAGGSGGAGGTVAGGEVQWVQIGGSDTEVDHAAGLAVTPDGHSVVVGSTGFMLSRPQMWFLDDTGAQRTVVDFPTTLNSSATRVAFDSTNQAVAVGYFSSEIDFGSGPVASVSRDLFVAKVTQAGAVSWAQTIGSGSSAFGADVLVDGSDDIVISGAASGTVTLPGQTLQLTGRQMLLAKLGGSDGMSQWAVELGDHGLGFPGFHTALGPAGDIYLCVNLDGSTPLGGGMSSVGDNDLLVARLDGSGTEVWSAVYGDAERQLCGGIAVGPNGGVFIGANIVGSADFGGGALQAASTNSDIAIAKLDADGNHLWSRIYGDQQEDMLNDLAVDGDGNVVVTGHFFGELDFGNGGVLQGRPSLPNFSMYVAKLDGDGMHQWSHAASSGGSLAVGAGVAFDTMWNVYVAGDIGGMSSLGGIPIDSTTNGSNDIFLAKISP